MALTFQRMPIVFTLSSFDSEMQMQLFGNDVIFSSSRVLVSNNR